MVDAESASDRKIFSILLHCSCRDVRLDRGTDLFVSQKISGLKISCIIFLGLARKTQELPFPSPNPRVFEVK